MSDNERTPIEDTEAAKTSAKNLERDDAVREEQRIEQAQGADPTSAPAPAGGSGPSTAGTSPSVGDTGTASS